MADELMIEGRVPDEHPAFPGHFPGNPLLPGVVMLDWAQSQARAHWRLGPLAALSSAKFLAPLRPGQPYRLHLARGPASITFRFELDGATAAQGAMSFAP